LRGIAKGSHGVRALHIVMGLVAIKYDSTHDQNNGHDR